MILAKFHHVDLWTTHFLGVAFLFKLSTVRRAAGKVRFPVSSSNQASLPARKYCFLKTSSGSSLKGGGGGRQNFGCLRLFPHPPFPPFMKWIAGLGKAMGLPGKQTALVYLFEQCVL